MLEEQQLLSLVQLAPIQEQEQQHALPVRMALFVPQQDSQKDINVDLEPTTMDQLDVKLVNLDTTVLMEKQQHEQPVTLLLESDSIHSEELLHVQLVLQNQNVRRLLIILVLKDGISNLLLRLVFLVQRLIIVSTLISLLVLLENLLTLNLHSSVLTVLLIIIVLILRLYFHVLLINGRQQDQPHVMHVEQDILVSLEVQKCLVVGMNGTLLMIEFVSNVL